MLLLTLHWENVSLFEVGSILIMLVENDGKHAVATSDGDMFELLERGIDKSFQLFTKEVAYSLT
jgi:hypothetical protein